MQKSKFVKNYGFSKRTIAARFRDAAAVIEKYGWVRGFFGNQTEGFCTIGAYREVCGGYDNLHSGSTKSNPLAKTFRKVNPTIGTSVINWNDTRTETSKEEVVSTFRKAARFLEHGGNV